MVSYRLPAGGDQLCQAWGEVSLPDGTRLVVPEGALVTCVDIHAGVVEQDLLPRPRDAALTLVGDGREIKPTALVLNRMATLVLPYTAADLDFDQDGAADVDPASL